jgi:hypothetical protein
MGRQAGGEGVAGTPSPQPSSHPLFTRVHTSCKVLHCTTTHYGTHPQHGRAPISLPPNRVTASRLSELCRGGCMLKHGGQACRGSVSPRAACAQEGQLEKGLPAPVLVDRLP